MMRRALLVVILAVLAGPARGSPSLDQALALVRGKAYRAATVDWPRVESSARATESREGTDAAIRYVLKALGDPHSSYQPPSASAPLSSPSALPLPGPATDIAQVFPRVADMPVLRIDGWSGADPAGAAQRVRTALAAALTPASCGIVLDFSTNRGGNMWPMMAGLAPLLEPGVVGAFRDANGGETRVERRGNTIMLGSQSQLSGLSPELRADAAPKWIALVIGAGSASSGEITPIMFHGQANVRFFGAPTAGLSTANQVFLLPNGGRLVLTTAVTLDRTGRPFPHGLEPDVRSVTPVADAAMWLRAKCHVGAEPPPPRD